MEPEFKVCCEENAEKPLTIQIQKLWDNGPHVVFVVSCYACRKAVSVTMDYYETMTEGAVIERAREVWNAPT